MNIVKYYNFINEESKIDDTFETNIDKHLLFFSDRIRKDYEAQGGKFPLFYQFYGNENVFYAIDLINRKRVRKLISNYRNIRWTILYPTIYKDTMSAGTFNLSPKALEDILSHSHQYYFYDFVEGIRRADTAPNRAAIRNIVHSEDGKDWVFILIKDRNCNLIKTKSRQESGKWAEHQLQKLYGWQESLHDIKLKVKKNGVIIDRANNWLRTILEEDEAEIFSVEDDPATFIKYDLVVDGNKKIEVKKYKQKERKIWKNGAPLPLMLAEQCKIADRASLTKVIGWFNENFAVDKRSYEYRKSLELLELPEREMATRFSRGHVHDICDTIREYYNSRIEKLLPVFNRIPEERWMSGIFGIYFAGDRTDRRNDFTIKIEEDGVRNIRCYWAIVPEWKGFNRIKLFMEIRGEAWEYILTEGNNFVRAFKLEDFEMYEDGRAAGRIETEDNVVYVFDQNRKLWSRQ
jgi:hypothetical protein